jgi:hypothetical protein
MGASVGVSIRAFAREELQELRSTCAAHGHRAHSHGKEDKVHDVSKDQLGNPKRKV